MELKIQPGMTTGEIADVDSASSGVNAASPARVDQTQADDPVSRIAHDVVANRITVDEGVNRILLHVMNSDMVATAPPSLRDEVSELLRSAIETDPIVASLVQRMRQ